MHVHTYMHTKNHILHSETLLTHNLHASNRTNSLLSKRVPAPLPSSGQNATNTALNGKPKERQYN